MISCVLVVGNFCYDFLEGKNFLLQINTSHHKNAALLLYFKTLIVKIDPFFRVEIYQPNFISCYTVTPLQ